MVEVDSCVLVGFLKDLFPPPWNLWYTIRKCKCYLNNVTISHTLREGNKLADCLSKHGHVCDRIFICSDENGLNDCCKHLVMLNRQGSMTFRS